MEAVKEVRRQVIKSGDVKLVALQELSGSNEVELLQSVPGVDAS